LLDFQFFKKLQGVPLPLIIGACYLCFMFPPLSFFASGPVALVVSHSRLWLSVVFGSLAGVLRLEGASGFVLYVMVCLVGLSIAIRRLRPADSGAWSELLSNSVFSGLFTFCLFWTLWFNVFMEGIFK
jgi:hypothetical protein